MEQCNLREILNAMENHHSKFNKILTKITAVQNEVALSQHRGGSNIFWQL